MASLACAFFLASGAWAAGGKSVPITPVTPPKALPAFQYKEGDAAISLDPGKYALTILHVWATWCVPCVAELPQVDKISEKYSPRGVYVIALSLDTDSRKVQEFYADKQILHLGVALDSMNKGFSISGIQGLPGTLFINKNGEIVARTDGPVDWQSKDVTDFIESQLQ